jgi:uncharacterized membrane protein
MVLCDLRKDLFDDLTLLDKGDKASYLTKTVIASLVAAFALVFNSQEGVIGSMLLAPLGAPLMGLVASVLALDGTSTATTIIFIIVGIVIMLLSGYGVGWFFKDEPLTEEMTKRYSISDKWAFVSSFVIGVSLGLVVLSGSSISEGIGSSIAVSLLPPIVNVGVTYVKTGIPDDEKKDMMKKSFMISIYNALGVLAACLLIFSINCKIPWLTYGTSTGDYKTFKTV